MTNGKATRPTTSALSLRPQRAVYSCLPIRGNNTPSIPAQAHSPQPLLHLILYIAASPTHRAAHGQPHATKASSSMATTPGCASPTHSRNPYSFSASDSTSWAAHGWAAGMVACSTPCPESRMLSASSQSASATSPFSLTCSAWVPSTASMSAISHTGA